MFSNNCHEKQQQTLSRESAHSQDVDFGGLSVSCSEPGSCSLKIHVVPLAPGSTEMNTLLGCSKFWLRIEMELP